MTESEKKRFYLKNLSRKKYEINPPLKLERNISQANSLSSVAVDLNKTNFNQLNNNDSKNILQQENLNTIE